MESKTNKNNELMLYCEITEEHIANELDDIVRMSRCENQMLKFKKKKLSQSI